MPHHWPAFYGTGIKYLLYVIVSSIREPVGPLQKIFRDQITE